LARAGHGGNLGETLGEAGLYSGGCGALACGPEMKTARRGRPSSDSSSSPARMRGRGQPRQVGSPCQRPRGRERGRKRQRAGPREALRPRKREKRGAGLRRNWAGARPTRGEETEPRGEIRAREKRRERREPAGEREGEENLGRRWPTRKEERRWARVAWARKKSVAEPT
jgi:hypothetical protein